MTSKVIEDYHDIMQRYDPTRNSTRNIMTKFEKNAIIGLRSEQLQRGARPLVEFDPSHFQPRDIAHRELQERKLPMMICRKLYNGEKEYWRIDDMIIS